MNDLNGSLVVAWWSFAHIHASRLFYLNLLFSVLGQIYLLSNLANHLLEWKVDFVYVEYDWLQLIYWYVGEKLLYA